MTQQITSKYLILYADDDEDDRLLLQDAFISYSANTEMVCVNNGLEAIGYLESLHSFDPLPCLVILDINMPILNGKETLVKIRNLQRFEDLPVILFSTSSQKQDKDFAALYHAGFITKPLEARQLKIIINMFIDHCTEDVRKKIRDH